LRLTEPERRALESVGASLVDPESVVALCGYGSKVAGYARPDSDYDLIVVAKKFGEGVRYRYVKTPVESSALVVDEGLLRRDARAAYLGEFVAGRLLNVYEPILNERLLLEVELDYKRRVMVEALFELASDYGDFNRHITVPYDYFLFEKLRKRAQIYPPALYSYVQTYTCPLGKENRRLSVGGFRLAAEALSSRGFITTTTEGVRLFPEKMKGDAFTKVLSVFSLTARGITQYAVHGYAGRVGLGVFRREALSKLKRMRERPEPPLELEKPRSLLQLTEGRFLADASRLNQELAEVAGFNEFEARERTLGEPYATTRVVTLSSGKREKSFVIKSFSDVRSLKWALLGVWAATARRFSMTPLARLEREYGSTVALKRSGVNVPSVLAVALEERIMVKDYVGGPPLSKVIDGLLAGERGGLESVAAYGKLLAEVHRAGLALGDAKASNVVAASDGLYLTDLEQSIAGGDQAWDLAEFLYFTAKLSIKEERMMAVADAFLKGYAAEGDRATVAKASNVRYLNPFRPFLTPGMTKMLRGLMQQYS